MHVIALLGALLSSALTPVKTWCPPDAPLTVSVMDVLSSVLVLTSSTLNWPGLVPARRSNELFLALVGRRLR